MHKAEIAVQVLVSLHQGPNQIVGRPNVVCLELSCITTQVYGKMLYTAAERIRCTSKERLQAQCYSHSAISQSSSGSICLMLSGGNHHLPAAWCTAHHEVQIDQRSNYPWPGSNDPLVPPLLGWIASRSGSCCRCRLCLCVTAASAFASRLVICCAWQKLRVFRRLIFEQGEGIT